jgi:hypothetical protein
MPLKAFGCHAADRSGCAVMAAFMSHIHCMQVGHMQPVAWFRFHNRRDHKRWAELSEPKTVWEGADNDLDIRRTRRENASTQGTSPEHPGAP